MGSSGHHIVPFKTYLNVLIVLLVMTGLTVAFAPSVSGIELGIVSTMLAIGIASFKAFLVGAYFMHLKYDDKLFVLLMGTAVFFLILLFAFSVGDIYTRILPASPL